MSDNSVLVVDDNPDNLDLVRILLECEGWEVRTAEDGPQALRTLATYRPGLILMDIQLPGMDGLEVTRRLRADPAYGQVIILAITAYAVRGGEERARAAGCNGYITKPIDTRNFGKLIRSYLETARAS